MPYGKLRNGTPTTISKWVLLLTVENYDALKIHAYISHILCIRVGAACEMYVESKMKRLSILQNAI